MSNQKTILVATVVHPERRFRIPEKDFDAANAAAKKAGRESPFIVQKEGCEGGKAYDQLTKPEQKKVKQREARRQEEFDAEQLAAEEG